MDRNGVDIVSFLTSNKSMIIAPAGHGKTHTIVNCLESYKFSGKKILVLTHTNAGIASIREKILLRSIESCKFEIMTICSFAIDIVHHYVSSMLLPDDSDMNEKYKEAERLSIRLLKVEPIKIVLKAKYEHVIVDEYQDCDSIQHKLIEGIGQIISTHILGDPLQGIFDFNGSPVNLDGKEFDEYRKNIQYLTTPWRWKKSGNVELGEDLLKIRSLLREGKSVDLTKYHSIQYVKVAKGDFYSQDRTAIKTIIYNLLKPTYKSNVLIIHPLSFSKNGRIDLLKRVHNLGMIESIDDADYYNTVQKFETETGDGLICAIKNFIQDTCVASELSKWFHDDGSLVSKRDEKYLDRYHRLKDYLKQFKKASCIKNIIDLIEFIRQEFGCRVVRCDVYYTILRILQQAVSSNISMSEALKLNRDKTRKVGRHINGKYIGTTLLTKGLECDTVLVLDAHKFDSPKHLYVALSRACSRLIVSADSPILHPYPKQNTTKKTKIQHPSLFSDEDFE